jgi:hypothetical protein
VKENELCCKNCRYVFEEDEFYFCRKNAPNGRETMVGGLRMGFQVTPGYFCGEGEWRVWYDNNRGTKSLKIYCFQGKHLKKTS